jgi:hypothetical protein
MTAQPEFLLTCARCGMQERLKTARQPSSRLCSVCGSARITATWCALLLDEEGPGFRIAREITRLRLPIVMTCALLRMGRPAEALRALEPAEQSGVQIPPGLFPAQRRNSDRASWPTTRDDEVLEA